MSAPAKPSGIAALTQARVALGRSGQSLPTAALLQFQLDHARARDAVHAELAAEGFAKAVGHEVIEVHSRAEDRATYLRRPDLGRRLRAEDAERLPRAGGDLAIIVSDGLSAPAVEEHAAPMVRALLARLEDWEIAPLVLAGQGRVAIGDEIGAALGTELALVLIGERPGLSAPNSLGAYLTWAPKRGRLDSERNCVSNIRPPHGLSYEKAADIIERLLRAAKQRRLTGTALKDGSGTALPEG